MELRAFTICRTCSELFPSCRSCPKCHGDEAAAQEMVRAHAVAVAAEQPRLVNAPKAVASARSASDKRMSAGLAALAFTAALGTAVLAILTRV